MEPLLDYLLVRRHETKPTNLIVPDSVKEKNTEVKFEVLKVGPGRYVGSTLVPCDAKIGDMLYVNDCLVLRPNGLDEDQGFLREGYAFAKD